MTQLVSTSNHTGSSSSAEEYSRAWRRRKAIFDNIFWRPQSGLWQDWDVENGRHLPGFYGSTLVPLMWGCGSNITQHLEVLARLRALGVLDYPGGIPTSLNFSSELQWDFPNVWAPLHWFLVAGWQNSSAAELRKVSREVAERWISSVYVGWQMHNQTIFEKVSLSSSSSSSSSSSISFFLSSMTAPQLAVQEEEVNM